MTWQKVRKQLRDLWSKEVAKDLDVHIARYRKSANYDDLGRVTFVYKKVEIYILSDSEDWNRCWELYDMGRLYVNNDSTACSESDKLGYYDVDRFYKLTNFYLNELNISEAFNSNVLLFQIYAILDRRTGKRTLVKNKELIDTNPLLKIFYDLRVNA
ncbi:SF0329 family protein [Marinagarivorans algicola]|uniref:SF0329 family protein n=1 Tax=Marinagarivorans algicola TaxID=1513270 RepID=UPI003735F873